MEQQDNESVSSGDATAASPIRIDEESLLKALGPLEDKLEENFFGPLAGPERTHEPGQPKQALPFGPMLTLFGLSTLLLSVFLAAVAWPMADPEARPPPYNYYQGADIVGLVMTMLLAGMLAWSFISAALTDPGRVPRRWPWDPKMADPTPNMEGMFEEASGSSRSQLLSVTRTRGLERKRDGRTRFCKKCNVYKPDRAHHCKKLGRCVLEMDHWCPWIRNTVGYRNRKFFFLSVTYGWAVLLTYCLVLGPYLVPAAKLNSALDFFIIFCWVLACIEGALLFALWVFHIFLTVHAFTTIEFREKHLAKDTKKRRSGDKIRDLYKQSVYDGGVWANFIHLLGPNILLWLLPTRYGMPNNELAGVVFKTRKDHPLSKTLAAERSSVRLAHTDPSQQINALAAT